MSEPLVFAWASLVNKKHLGASTLEVFGELTKEAPVEGMKLSQVLGKGIPIPVVCLRAPTR